VNNITKRQLNNWFDNESKYSIEDGILPNGRETNDCFGWAVHIAARLPGHARIYHIDETNDKHNLDADEHYFVVVNNKWIVDPWMGIFQQETPTVMDIDNPTVEYYYGPRKYWKSHYGGRKDWSSFGEGLVKPLVTPSTTKKSRITAKAIRKKTYKPSTVLGTMR